MRARIGQVAAAITVTVAAVLGPAVVGTDVASADQWCCV